MIGQGSSAKSLGDLLSATGGAWGRVVPAWHDVDLGSVVVAVEADDAGGLPSSVGQDGVVFDAGVVLEGLEPIALDG